MQLQVPGQGPPQSYNQPQAPGYQPIDMNQLTQTQMQKLQ